MRVALYQPDQAGNVGTILRTAACFGLAADLIEPCGFPFSDRALKRAGMDYVEMAEVTRHADWAAFAAQLAGRLVLFTTASDALPLPEARFDRADTLLFGSESRGAPAEVHERAEMRVRIPQVEGTRSLNLAVAAGIGLAEALRQTAPPAMESASHCGRRPAGRN
ncbi:MAG TPA: tRNA (cytidine(34)-2'-O)-methyltransferase [Allosphingosinicella sp.]|nr:tRNA (cytidine(34)-2'-O)-methyltransferase [Allosphingosinicella sp.]